MAITKNIGKVVGDSAYEIAVEQGFNGTENEWLESLKGEKGDTGNAGADGTVEFDSLSDAQIASLKGEAGTQFTTIGDDLTLESTDDGNVLQLADRAYTANSHKGKGYKILRENLVDGVNTLTQSMISSSNTIYEIRYDFDLDEQAIEIPEGCTLKFEGGSLSNGELAGDLTTIMSYPVEIFLNLALSGSFNVSEAYPEWFGAKGDSVNDDKTAIQTALDTFSCVKLGDKKYKLSGSLNLNIDNCLVGQNNSYIVTDGTFDVINVGFRTSISNLKFVVDVPCTIFSLSSEYMASSYSANDYIGSITSDSLYISTTCFINISKIFIFSPYSEALVGTAYKSLANGLGSGFWQVTVSDVSIIGKWENGILLDNTNDESATYNTWQTDAIFTNVKFFGCKNGITIKKDDLEDGEFPPERITFTNCSMQGRYDSQHFAIIEAGNRIVFNHCEPWDWGNTDGFKPFKINPNNVKGCTFNDCTSTGYAQVELIEDSNSYYGNGYSIASNTNNNQLSTYYLPFLFPSSRLEDGAVTYNEIRNMPSGIYSFPSNSAYNTLFATNGILSTGQGAYLEKLTTYNGGVMLRYYPLSTGTHSVNTFAYTTIKQSFENGDTTIVATDWKMFYSGVGLYSTEEEMVSDRVYCYGYNGLIGVTANAQWCTKYSDSYVLDALGYKYASKFGYESSSLPDIDYLRSNFDLGKQFFSLDTKKPYFYAGTRWVTADGETYNVKRSGISTVRPTPTNVGFQYFDTTLNKPIWWTGTTWVDSTGEEVS